MRWLPLEPEFVTNLPVIGPAHPLRCRYRRFLHVSIAMAASLHLIGVSGWLIRRDSEPIAPSIDLIKASPILPAPMNPTFSTYNTYYKPFLHAN